MTTIVKDGTEVTDPRLGRVRQPDRRNRDYPVSARFAAAAELYPRSYTWRCDLWLNQGREGSCVGHGFAHELAARPVPVAGVSGAWARGTYHTIQREDPWPGGAYPGACVDLETSALCREKGWVGPDRLAVGDHLLAFDQETQGVRWSRVTAVNHFPGASYRIVKAGGLVAAVTDTHRWVVRPTDSELPYGLVATEDLNTKWVVPLAAPPVDPPDKPNVADDLVELVAWCVTEGYFRPEWRRGNAITVRQKSHRGHVAALMERCGVARGHTPADGCHQWELSGAVARDVRDAAPNGEPRIDWLAELTPRQLRIFVAACCRADGHRRPSRAVGSTGRSALSGGHKDEQVFVQLPGGVLDAFLAACALAGIPTSRSAVHAASGCESWTVRIGSTVMTQRMERGPLLVGEVWCPTTEAGTFVARRGPSTWITGNSPVYEGTSVLTGVQVLRRLGYYTGYRWGLTMREAVTGIGRLGPAVLGLDWYAGMFAPDAAGFLHPTGDLGGGHCLLAIGTRIVWTGTERTWADVDVDASSVLLHNSWGQGWGVNGRARLSLADFARLLDDGGDACFPLRAPSTVLL